jgi:hypothetical protein
MIASIDPAGGKERTQTMKLMVTIELAPTTRWTEDFKDIAPVLALLLTRALAKVSLGPKPGVSIEVQEQPRTKTPK